jgi:tubulin polyglutamylase TTLL9
MWFDREYVRDTLDDVHLESHQRVNHFRNHYELTRKDNLIKNLKRRKKDLAKEGNTEEAAKYDFFPQTFQLPGEYSIFVESFKRSNSIWIMKPIAKSQGKGIFLFTKLSQISEWKNDARWKPENPQAEQYVAQEYVGNPMLIGGIFVISPYLYCHMLLD